MQQLSAKFAEMISSYDMAHAPLVLGAYGRLQQAIADHGTFDMRTRAAIALSVAAVGDCADCQFSYTIACRAAGWSTYHISAVYSGELIVYEEKITGLLAVARQIAGQAGDVDAQTWDQARQVGWTVEELAELFTHVFANIFTNYLNHYAATDADIPAVPTFHEASA